MVELRNIEQEKKDIQERQQKLDERNMNDLRSVLKTPEGRRFIWRLLEHGKIFHKSYTGNSDTFFNEGRRDMGLLILNDLMLAKPEAFTQMQREAASDPLKSQVRKGNQ